GAVMEGHGDLLGRFHDMVVGQDVPAVVINKARAGPLSTSAKLLLLRRSIGTEEPLEHLLQVLQILRAGRIRIATAGAREGQTPQARQPGGFLLDADLNHRRAHEIRDRLERLGECLYRFLTFRRNVRGGGHAPQDSRRTDQGRGGNQNRDPSYWITFHSLSISSSTMSIARPRQQQIETSPGQSS